MRTNTLLVVDKSVNEAFQVSQRVKAAALDCEFYMVDSLEAAKRHLVAAETDDSCMPAVILVGRTFPEDDAQALVSWSNERETGCAFLGPFDDTRQLLPQLARFIPPRALAPAV